MKRVMERVGGWEEDHPRSFDALANLISSTKRDENKNFHKNCGTIMP